MPDAELAVIPCVQANEDAIDNYKESERKITIIEEEINNNFISQTPLSPESNRETSDEENSSKECESAELHERDSLVKLKKAILLTKDARELRRLIRRLRYQTTKKLSSSFEDYVRGMKPGQNVIYYMIGRSARQLTTSPFLRRVVEAGFEVILMIEPILDDRVVRRLCKRYEHYQLVAVDSENLELPFLDQETAQKKRKRHSDALKEFIPLCKRFKIIFPNEIQKVVISDKLVKKSHTFVSCERAADSSEDEPCYVINKETGRVRLEINPESPFLRSLCAHAGLLSRKEEELNSLIKFLVKPPTLEDPLRTEDSSKFERSISVSS